VNHAGESTRKNEKACNICEILSLEIRIKRKGLLNYAKLCPKKVGQKRKACNICEIMPLGKGVKTRIFER
jgi:hypothetical protein